MHPILLCTSNSAKAIEFSRILRLPVDRVEIELEEIQSIDPVIVCKRKVTSAYSQLRKPTCVDDSGLALLSLNGFPGALVAHVLTAGGPGLIAQMIRSGAPRDAIAISVVGFADERGTKLFTGKLEGSITDTPRGSNGFGFDSVFVPVSEFRTLAELSPDEKDAISPRRRALDALALYLQGE